MKKYYQVFLSSASREFKKIRPQIIQEILKQDQYFPVAMELMSAGSSTFQMLSGYMHASDVCVLLLGEHMGSNLGAAARQLTDPELLAAVKQYGERSGLSDFAELTYTEYEYALASYLGIDVLPFVKSTVVSSVEAGTAEPNIARFYGVLRQKSAYSTWDEAPSVSDIIAALNHHVAIASDTSGWIRETDSAIYRSAALAGIRDISLDGLIPKEALRSWLSQATDCKLFYTTGNSFVSTYTGLLTEFAAAGGNVSMLCEMPGTAMLADIQKVEEPLYGDRSSIHQEFLQVLTELRGIQTRAKQLARGGMPGRIRIGFCGTLFRSSMLICQNKASGINNGWLTITLPPAKSRETISFAMHASPEDSHPNNLINRALQHFDAVWVFAAQNGSIFSPAEYVATKSTPENRTALGQREYWMQREQTAERTMRLRKRSRRILIETAAQHPLKDGLVPDTEFAARLDRTIRLYEEKTAQGYDVEIYVPGSVHLDFDGVPDECSLSQAGCTYLLEHGIPREVLHGEDLNDRFDDRREQTGVYNSADECFVAAQYFLTAEPAFGQLYCVCSPNQLMRKTLYYMQFGVIPQVVTVPVDQMFHHFLNEVYDKLPDILTNDHDCQSADSKEAHRTRQERRP